MRNPKTKLIVLRGPSGSGKSTVAKTIRATQSQPMALIEQDYLRRVVLKEKHSATGVNIELIKRTILFAIENSYDVVVEGIFEAGCYNDMFETIIQQHPTNNYFFYFDVSLDETLRRHQHKPNKDDFGEKEMRTWYKDQDFLTCTKEAIIPESNSLEETINVILSACDLSKTS